MADKMRISDTHIFFLTGPLSNWYKSPFTAILPFSDGPKLQMVFNCSEQWLMACKAWLFHDEASLWNIMATGSPAEQKRLGRLVGGFTVAEWDIEAAPLWNVHAVSFMIEGLWAKYQQDAAYHRLIDESDDRHIVEGNRHDKVWAVGLAWDDPDIDLPSQWKGTNWLGEAHMAVRLRSRLLERMRRLGKVA